jgi:hypothetical protein
MRECENLKLKCFCVSFYKNADSLIDILLPPVVSGQHIVSSALWISTKLCPFLGNWEKDYHFGKVGGD